MANKIKLLMTFRARLMLLLTACLLLTIVIVFALDYWAQQRINKEIVKQNEKVTEVMNGGFLDLMQAVSIATKSLGSEDLLYNVLSPEDMPKTIEAIIVANKEGKVIDSSIKELIDNDKTIFVPKRENSEEFDRKKIWVMDGDPLVGAFGNHNYNDKTYYYKTDTANKGLHWIILVTNQGAVINQVAEATNQLASQNQTLSNIRQWSTTVLLLVALMIAVIIGWQFTRPIQELASAARRVADSQLDFRVNIIRNDEVGQLAETFNEMIDGLKHKRELEEKLNQSERAAVIGRLTQSVAHEIRNPLNVINLSIDHVSSKFAPEDEAKRKQFTRILSSIKDEITRLKHMVSDLLNYGRPAQLTVQNFDMRGLVDETLALVRPQADDQGVEIKVEEDAAPTLVNGDREKLKSCLSNIVINALQAMPAGGSLTTAVHQRNGHIEVNISDTGTGIRRDDLGKVFEPYFSTKQAGFGLGLAVTKKIIEEHKGWIEVQSEENLGTTFNIKLKAAK
ncbi:MAG: HAMP domain-containing protein [Acidobacteria bacterium]|nr:HAMP domain-containing protein [Acidobacteriota bacterium]